MRKSPVKHHVKSHKRKEKQVKSYSRGKGQRLKIVKKIKTTHPKHPKAYTVNFLYSKKPESGESVVVISTDYHKALREAFEEKHDPRTPIEVEVIDPDLGRVLRVIGGGLKKIAKVGGKYAAKGLRATGRVTKAGLKITGKMVAEAAAEARYSYKAKQLLRKAYSPDKITRTIARAKLRADYPEIYALCDFSRRTSRVPPRNPVKQRFITGRR